MRIIPDGPLAHEEAWAAWQAEESACIVPHDYPDPTSWLKKQQGPPGLFQYVPHEGVLRLQHFPWTRMKERFDLAAYPPGLMDCTLTFLDNKTGYGLIFGRLLPLYKGYKVVPWTKTEGINVGDVIDREGITCIVCAGKWYALTLAKAKKPEGTSMRGVINCCTLLSAETWRTIHNFFKGPVYNHWGTTIHGTIAFSRGNILEPYEVGDIVVPCKVEGEELFVRTPTSLMEGDGWQATGKRGRLEDRRLFIYGDM